MKNAKECNVILRKRKSVAFVVILAMLLIFAAAWMGAKAFAADSDKTVMTDSIIVVYKDGVSTSSIEKQLAAKDSEDSDVTRLADNTRVAVADVPEGQSVNETIRDYESSSMVKYAQPNYFYKTMSYSGGDTYYDYLWHFANIGVQQASLDYSSIGSTSGVRVAVLDTGVNASNPDLTLLNKSLSATRDSDGHGTHVTGILAATADNSLGVAGVGSAITGNNIEVIVKGVFSYYPGYGYGATTETIIDGIKYALNNNARVINMSLGYVANSATEACDAVLAAQLDVCESQGVTVVAAAGNDGDSMPNYPADYKTCISVTAVNRDDSHASYSNYNNYKDIAAPGTEILSTYGTDYGYETGTSMASPVVAGVVAAMYSVYPGITPAQVRETLYETATDLGPTGWDKYFGYGLVNADKAVLAAKKIRDQNSINVTFVGNGGTVGQSSRYIVSGNSLSTLPTARRSGYTFAGWYDSRSAGKRIYASSLAVTDRTYYAHWTRVTVATKQLKSLYASSRRIHAAASTVSGARAYQFKYSRSKTFSNSSYKIRYKGKLRTAKLAGSRYYYVKVRAYKLDSTGSRVYSSWSKAKKVWVN